MTCEYKLYCIVSVYMCDSPYLIVRFVVMTERDEIVRSLKKVVWFSMSRVLELGPLVCGPIK